MPEASLRDHDDRRVMGSEVVYEIARYDVRIETEVLIERVQLLRVDGELASRGLWTGSRMFRR